MAQNGHLININSTLLSSLSLSSFPSFPSPPLLLSLSFLSLREKPVREQAVTGPRGTHAQTDVEGAAQARALRYWQ